MNALERRQFYEKLDWSQPDIVLSKQTGRSRSVILCWRRKLGKKYVPHSQIKRHKHLLQEAKRWQWSDGVTALAARHKMSRQWIYRIATKLKVQVGVKAGGAR